MVKGKAARNQKAKAKSAEAAKTKKVDAKSLPVKEVTMSDQPVAREPASSNDAKPFVMRIYAYDKIKDADGRTKSKKYKNFVNDILRNAIEEINTEPKGVAYFEAYGNEHIKPLLDLLSFFSRKKLTVTYPDVIVDNADGFLKTGIIKVEGTIEWQSKRRAPRRDLYVKDNR